MEVRLLNYLPDWDGHFLDNGIATHTIIFNVLGMLMPRRGNWLAPFKKQTYRNIKIMYLLMCSHSEIWTRDTKFSDEWLDHGLCWTSTMRGDEENGVTMRPAYSVLYHPHRWTYFRIDIQDEWYPSLIAEMSKKVNNNQGYDKLTILSFFFPWRFGNKSKYICSEFCHLSLFPHSDGRLFRNLARLDAPSPIRLAHRVWMSGYDLYSLETNKVILKGKE